jgi:hypothetical protein
LKLKKNEKEYSSKEIQCEIITKENTVVSFLKNLDDFLDIDHDEN